ncbi:hypothetical protein WH95_00905 [Kiloniella litopenaei]|uniref:Uncharacterized protein n=1 Tax=Kiloniella litopenaei TaxID=1549748 RepID=A0A0M2RGK2_9PROT|nr:hypothetical protein [Kiloniella litopenaei]KKJ78678.1 hypothetical protein WH95_00905 [Kiloniella litopenaei]
MKKQITTGTSCMAQYTNRCSARNSWEFAFVTSLAFVASFGMVVSFTTPGHADDGWCGFSNNEILEGGINRDSSCRIDTAKGELVLVEGTKKYNASITSWFTGAENPHAGAQLNECRGPKRKVLSGDTLLTAPKMRFTCSRLKSGDHVMLDRNGMKATLHCDQYVATNITLEAEGKSKNCAIPTILQELPAHLKKANAWYGLTPDAIEKKEIQKDSVCEVTADDQSYPEKMQFSFIWGRKSCQALKYYSDRHSCGWFAHNQGLTGKRQSDYLHVPKLNELCTGKTNEEVLVTEPFWRKDHKSTPNMSEMNGYIQCENGQAKNVRLEIKPLAGETAGKTCAIPQALLDDKPNI